MLGHQCVVVIFTPVKNHPQDIPRVSTAPIHQGNGYSDVITSLSMTEIQATLLHHSFCLLELTYPSSLSVVVNLFILSVKQCHTVISHQLLSTEVCISRVDVGSVTLGFRPSQTIRDFFIRERKKDKQ